MSGMFDIIGAARRGGLRGFGGYLDDFEASLADANHDWPIHLARLRTDVNAEIGPSVSLVRGAIAFFEALDQSTPDAIINSVASLVEQLGPVGAYAGAALRAIQAFANWVTSSMPAFALQLQSQHYAQVDMYLGNRLLGFTNPDTSKALQFQRLAGWAESIWSVDAPSICGVSAGEPLGSMKPMPADLELALDRFRWIAGPRATVMRPCTQWSVDFPSWSSSPEGRASIPVANRIASALSNDAWAESTLQERRCKVWSSRGLVLAFNIAKDINPGSPDYSVHMNAIKVNCGFLPNEMLSMLGTYYSLFFQLTRVLGGRLGGPDMLRIRQASFGPDFQGLKKYHLLRLLIKGDPSIGLGVLAECGRRFRPGTGPGGPGGSGKQNGAPRPWSTTKKVVVGTAVVSVPVGVYFLGQALRWWK